MSRSTALRRAFLGAALVTGILGSAGFASADTVSCINPTATPSGSATPGYTGLLFNTVYCGNDPFDGQGGYINGSPSLVKINILDLAVDVPAPGVDGIGPGNQATDLVLSLLGYSGGEIKSGTWTLAHQAGELVPTIVVIKAGPAFFLQSVIAGVLTGTFNTALLGNKGLSHISLYDGAKPGGGTPEVPIPAALPLLLTGIGGLTWLSRRKKSASKG